YDYGEIDVLGIVPRDRSDRDALLARPDLVRTLGTCTSYVGFNVKRPPFDDPNVRMAFAKSIDKDAFAGDLATTAHVAPSFVTHDLPGHAHGDRTQDYDPAAARGLLAASKYGPPVDGRVGGVELNPLERERLYGAASHRLSQQAPGAWISWSEQWWLVSPSVKGYEVSAFDFDFAQLSLARIVGARP